MIRCAGSAMTVFPNMSGRPWRSRLMLSLAGSNLSLMTEIYGMSVVRALLRFIPRLVNTT